MADKRLKTDYNALFRFANELDKFCDYLHGDVSELKRETDYICGYSWKGEQSEEFQMVVNDNGEAIERDIMELRDLIEKIKDSAEKLRIASEHKIS